MAGTKEIKRRLRSVQNTSKITYAMKLVSAAKLKKVQDAVTNSRAYTKELSALLARLNGALSGSFSHPLLERREKKDNIAIVVIGGQRGLCGGYNSNLNKRLEAELKEIAASSPNAKVSLYVFGKKPAEYCRKTNRKYVKAFEDLSENTATWPVEEICLELEQAFIAGAYDEVRICFTRFHSAITMKPVCEQLFPLDANVVDSAGKEPEAAAPVKFEPDVNSVLAAVLPRIARTKFRQASLDAKASETGSRMTAMDAATRNAKELTKKLQRSYNKVRQQGITSQLLDIIGGAEAV